MKNNFYISVALFYLAIIAGACKQPSAPSKALLGQLSLKRGTLISCGPGDKQFGTLDFDMSCSKDAKMDFNLAVELLHSFEYDEAEKAFAKVIDETPDCAMAYWGVAMSNFHALWTPPSEDELKKGATAIEIARGISNKTKREEAYVEAIGTYFDNWQSVDHRTRSLRFEAAMEKLHDDYPTDKEAAIFYALALDAAADPTDKSYARQKKAGNILTAMYSAEPSHPGIIHYIIHTYDYPGLAIQALPAARRYASVAASSAHAQHMPSHIFTRLGLWDECIQSNMQSVAAAQCYAESAGINGHWDEELHGLDYLVYAYLQKGDNKRAQEQLQYLEKMKEINPPNFKVAYAMAAIPARYVLENRNWRDAASLQIIKANMKWQAFPWQESITYFAKALGYVNLRRLDSAKQQLDTLYVLRERTAAQKDGYRLKQVNIEITMAEAWLTYRSGKAEQGLGQMRLAADMEDSTGKHPVTPGEVLPARELLGDMLMDMKQYKSALQEYETALQKAPNRFNSLWGAAMAAEKSLNIEKAKVYYKQLMAISNAVVPERKEITQAKAFLEKHSTL